MYVCMYVCMYVRLGKTGEVDDFLRMYVCMYVCEIRQNK
jgi:hypothetical protein